MINDLLIVLNLNLFHRVVYHTNWVPYSFNHVSSSFLCKKTLTHISTWLKSNSQTWGSVIFTNYCMRSESSFESEVHKNRFLNHLRILWTWPFSGQPYALRYVFLYATNRNKHKKLPVTNDILLITSNTQFIRWMPRTYTKLKVQVLLYFTLTSFYKRTHDSRMEVVKLSKKCIIINYPTA